MTKPRRIPGTLAALLSAAVAVGCSCEAEPAPSRATPAATDAAASPATPAASEARAYDAEQAGRLSGAVSFAGEVPERRFQKMIGEAWCMDQWSDGGFHLEDLLVVDGRVQNAFVWIKDGLAGYSFPAPSEPVVITNKDCLYRPRVVGVQTGQTLRATNEDKVMHNVHTKPRRNREQNQSLPYPDARGYRDFEFRRAEVMVEVVCDVHPWMKGWIGAVDHPFFAVTDERGEFAIDGLPAGSYTVGVWQEKLGEREFTVDLGERGDVRHDVAF